jgi:rhodanese-related sulfurtransferase
MAETRTLNADELAGRLESDVPPVLVDVMPAARFVAVHLPGAVNACVYEVAFLDHVAELVDSPETPIVVYGTREGNRASADAAEKLRRAGYTDVADFRGGVAEWTAAGRPLEGTGETRTAPPPAGEHTLVVDAGKSAVRWVGRNLAGRHHGSIAIRDGEIRLVNGVLAGGRVTVDMTKITCDDIPDSKMNGVLIAHLESDDFFDTERFPEAGLAIDSAEPIDGAAPGRPNLRCRGSLSMKGVTNPVEFEAVGGAVSDGGWAAQAQLRIDRTKWGVNYGSGRLYDFLGMHLVNDYVSLDLTVVAG